MPISFSLYLEAAPYLRSMIPRLLLLAFLVCAGCGTATEHATRSLPENIMAHPAGTVGLLTASPASALPTALRALGIPYVQITPENFMKSDLALYPTYLLDELALDEEKMAPIYRRAMQETRYGKTFIMLRQNMKPLAAITAPIRRITPRDVDFGLRLVSIRPSDPMLNHPNDITRADMDSLARGASQIVAGGPDARAILSSNTNDADRAALLLWDPYENGAVWYLSIPIVARAAAGHPAEQKLLANLLSNR